MGQGDGSRLSDSAFDGDASDRRNHPCLGDRLQKNNSFSPVRVKWQYLSGTTSWRWIKRMEVYLARKVHSRIENTQIDVEPCLY